MAHGWAEWYVVAAVALVAIAWGLVQWRSALCADAARCCERCARSCRNAKDVLERAQQRRQAGFGHDHPGETRACSPCVDWPLLQEVLAARREMNGLPFDRLRSPALAAEVVALERQLHDLERQLANPALADKESPMPAAEAMILAASFDPAGVRRERAVTDARAIPGVPSGILAGDRSRPVRVLHVIEALQGGPASYMREILPGQRDALGAENIALLVPRRQAGELGETTGMQVSTFRQQRFRLLHVPLLGWHTLRWVRRHRPTVVHAQGTFAGIAVRLALALLPRPPRIVYCAHGWAFDRRSARWKTWLVAFSERLLAKRCDAIVCISGHDYRSALRCGIDRQRLLQIPNAVSEPAATVVPPIAWPEGRRRFLFVGRFDRQKGIDVFLAAMRELGDQAFAYAIGSPVVGHQAVTDIPANVMVTGWLPREQVLAYMASAEVVVVPSRWEGFGLAALEAMRAGRAIIASRIGGLPELVRHGNTGLLVPPEDVASLVGAMRASLHLNLRGMGNRARQRYERLYRVERLNAQLLELYECLLDPGPSPFAGIKSPSPVATARPKRAVAKPAARARRPEAYWQG